MKNSKPVWPVSAFGTFSVLQKWFVKETRETGTPFFGSPVQVFYPPLYVIFMKTPIPISVSSIRKWPVRYTTQTDLEFTQNLRCSDISFLSIGFVYFYLPKAEVQVYDTEKTSFRQSSGRRYTYLFLDLGKSSLIDSKSPATILHHKNNRQLSRTLRLLDSFPSKHIILPILNYMLSCWWYLVLFGWWVNGFCGIWMFKLHDS